MIEKITTKYPDFDDLKYTINQLVDAVNEFGKDMVFLRRKVLELGYKDPQTRPENVHPDAESRPKNVQDKFAEQHQWIGCVCRFWYDNPDNTVLDYLGKIQTGENGIEYYGKETYDWFPYCEPILPTDNAIYKGGDNDNPAN